jgi:hypothetical protein
MHTYIRRYITCVCAYILLRNMECGYKMKYSLMIGCINMELLSNVSESVAISVFRNCLPWNVTACRYESGKIISIYGNCEGIGFVGGLWRPSLLDTDVAIWRWTLIRIRQLKMNFPWSIHLRTCKSKYLSSSSSCPLIKAYCVQRTAELLMYLCLCHQ